VELPLTLFHYFSTVEKNYWRLESSGSSTDSLPPLFHYGRELLETEEDIGQ